MPLAPRSARDSVQKVVSPASPSDIQRLNGLIDSEPNSTLYVVTPPAFIVPIARDLPGYTPAAPGLR